jgi:hypothetical protein
MHYFSQFTFMVGAALALQALFAAWLFRTAHAWIGWKLVVPTSLVVLACWAPYTAKAIMGLPIKTAIAALPEEARLVAFFPHDQDGLVDIWLASGPVPRAYEIALDQATKAMLRTAAADLAQGKPVFVRKRKGEGPVVGRSGASTTDLKDDSQPRYEVDDSALVQLPRKQ